MQMGCVMEVLILLLFAVSGAVAALWVRMNRLMLRVAELEAGWVPAIVEQSCAEPPVTLREAPPATEFATDPDALASESRDALSPEVSLEVYEVSEPERESFFGRLADLGRQFDFEEVFGRLMPIWAGAIALAVGGFFLVRWFIEAGLLDEQVRVGLGLAFGLCLLCGAEIAFRFEHRVRDVRVRQALAGAGLATLYASFYLAGSFYGLIGPGLAFTGLAGVTALAILLSFRFGVPSAMLGLLGGFAAPALAGSTEANLPLLAGYLALVTGGLVSTGQRQRRPWLGLAALAGGLGWGALMLLTGPFIPANVFAIGGYVVVVGVMLPALIGAGPLGQVGRIAASGLATLQIAALVDQSGYDLLAWGCYVLLAAAMAILGARWYRLREASGLAAALSACLLAAWPGPPTGWFALVAAAFTIIFVAPPLIYVWRQRARSVDWGELALYPIALIAAICIQFELPLIGARAVLVALVALTLAVGPALAAWKALPGAEEDIEPGPFATLVSAFVMALLAGLLALPAWCAPLVPAALAVPAFALRRNRKTDTMRALQGGISLVGLVLLAATSRWTEMAMLFEGASDGPEWQYAMRWLAAAIPFILLGDFENGSVVRRFADGMAAFLAYGTFAMMLPGALLPLTLATGTLLFAWRLEGRDAAIVTLLGLGGLWAVGPVAEWVIAAVDAVTGAPMFLDRLPAVAVTIRTVVPLSLALAGLVWLRAPHSARRRMILSVCALLLAVIVAHVGFKQIFAIGEASRFVTWGPAERTLWEGILGAVGFALYIMAGRNGALRWLGLVMGGLALAHFALFSLLLHNPLWSEQAVGPWPLVNLLAVSYGLAIGLALWLRRGLDWRPRLVLPIMDAAVMLLIALLTLSELRQLFAGSLLLVAPVGQQEDLLRSIVAIGVALGFLGWGTWKGQRSWRIGSLVLMLLAVFKVFLFDASGLEGLARIGSFLALGGCLISIGWFYSRQLAVKHGAEA